MKFAVIKTGGKQYLVKKGDDIVVDHLGLEKDAEVAFDTLAEGDDEKNEITIGRPLISTKVKGTIIDNIKGDKIRVARYKSKVRSRKVRGFRQSLSQVKITQI